MAGFLRPEASCRALNGPIDAIGCFATRARPHRQAVDPTNGADTSSAADKTSVPTQQRLRTHRKTCQERRGRTRLNYLVATQQRKNRQDMTGKINGWKEILNTLTVHYGDRIAANSIN